MHNLCCNKIENYARKIDTAIKGIDVSGNIDEFGRNWILNPLFPSQQNQI